ncbi:hypothetical protein RchiOBHm_Chr2g0153671 [Rosa chinensis]|uniref:Transmembrane protein n=1 Tax=Rosa chinensis TaxID=74649 RepID=A0A2P6S0R5_ROSCH|nr:hypothetical protein RchiOBHm_Chr2g0153671 [Rosa chinensis]
MECVRERERREEEREWFGNRERRTESLITFEHYYLVRVSWHGTCGGCRRLRRRRRQGGGDLYGINIWFRDLFNGLICIIFGFSDFVLGRFNGVGGLSLGVDIDMCYFLISCML